VKLGVVTTSYPRHDGDPAGGWVAEHAGFLRARGHEVEVVAAAPGDALFAGAGAPEAFDADLPAALLAGAGYSLRLVARLARRARRWDAAICHWLLPSAIALRLAAPRLPLVGVAHSGDVHLARRLGLAAPLAALALTPRTELVFVSRALRASLADAAPAPLRRAIERSRIQPMGIDLARFAAARARVHAARRAAAAPPPRPRVVFLGRLVPIKGADLVVAAAARLTGPAEIIVAGAGPEAAALAAAARAARLADGVTLALPGAVRGAARDDLLASADLVVVPSRVLPDGRAEGQPRVALEAMAAGAALVASHSGGLGELPSGAVARCPADAAGLATVLGGLLADPERRAALAAAGRTHAADLAWSAIGRRLVPERLSGRV
jgi:glycosyltransferase involved in cell wall biosynthesis